MEEPVQLQIGKKGVTSETINEILKNLKNRPVKVKLLKNFTSSNNRKQSAKEIIDLLEQKVKVESKLVGSVLNIKREK